MSTCRFVRIRGQDHSLAFYSELLSYLTNNSSTVTGPIVIIYHVEPPRAEGTNIYSRGYRSHD